MATRFLLFMASDTGGLGGLESGWLRSLDSNQGPSGYEPDELPLLHSAIRLYPRPFPALPGGFSHPFCAKRVCRSRARGPFCAKRAHRYGDGRGVVLAAGDGTGEGVVTRYSFSFGFA